MVLEMVMMLMGDGGGLMINDHIPMSLFLQNPFTAIISSESIKAEIIPIL